MSTINTTIRTYMNTRLNTLSPAMPVAWENFELAISRGIPWLRTFLLPATPDNVTLGTDKWTLRPGVFQVDVLYPIGKGWKDAMDKVDDICDLFLADDGILVFDSNIKILIMSAGPGPAMREENWYKVPVSIRYECYSNN